MATRLTGRRTEEDFGTEMTEVSAWQSDPVIDLSAKTQAAVKRKGGVVVDFKDVEPTKSPVFKVNGKEFKITHIRHREGPDAAWKTVKIADLSQTELDKLAKTCEGLFQEIHPSSRTNLEQVTFKFSRKNLEPSWKDRLPGPFKRKMPSEHPLTLNSISTKTPGAKKEDTHKFNLEEFDEPSQKRLKTMIGEADKPVHSIATKAPRTAPRSIASIEKTKQLKKSPETDTLIKPALKNLEELFDEALKTPKDAEKRQALATAIDEFERRYHRQGYDKEFKEVDEMKQVLQQLVSKGSLFPIKPQTATGTIVEMPADGNCFFHAMAKALNELPRDSVTAHGITGPVTHDSLRQVVVDSLRMVLEPHTEPKAPGDQQIEDKVRSLIDESIEAFIASGKAQIRDEIASLQLIAQDPQYDKKKIEERIAVLQQEQQRLEASASDPDRFTKYLDQMSKTQTFATKTEMYAISQIFGVNIAIHQKVRGQIRTDLYPPITHESATKTIKILYVNGDHFDLIQEEEDEFFDCISDTE